MLEQDLRCIMYLNSSQSTLKFANQYAQKRRNPNVSESEKEELRRKRRPWGNVTEHCLVEAARAEVLCRWIGLPEDHTLDMKIGASLHDFPKRPEIEATRQANESGQSPLATVRKVNAESEQILIDAGFSERIRRLATASGGDAPQLIKTQRILDQDTLSDDDWAYLIVHFVDDCSRGADWVEPSRTNPDGTDVNVIDYRLQAQKDKRDYDVIGREIRAELAVHPTLGGLDPHDAMAILSHQIEQKLAQQIAGKTGEAINPLLIPELVDEKIRMAINGR